MAYYFDEPSRTFNEYSAGTRLFVGRMYPAAM